MMMVVPLFVQVGKQFHYIVTVAAVEVTGRLIRKYQFWLVYNRPGYGHTLLLTA